MKVLAINPGSTSTKIGLFDDEEEIFEKKITHSTEELKAFAAVTDQLDVRMRLVREILAAQDVSVAELDAVAARGGLLRPLAGGTYRVNAKMLDDLRQAVMGEHASNLGALIADALVAGTAVPAFIVDPVVVDELEPVARVTGIPEIKRISIFHALNQKAAARKAAEQLGKPYAELNLVVAHLGGGISVGAHRRGRVIDVNDALYGDGPMAPERAGRVPPYALARLIESRQLTDRQVRKCLAGGGGMVAYLDTSDMARVEELITAGDEKAALVYDAMIYQAAKEIGSLAAVLKGAVDAIVITGGLAHSARFVEGLRGYIDFLGRIIVIPGEEELEALAAGALRVLRGQEEAKEY